MPVIIATMGEHMIISGICQMASAPASASMASQTASTGPVTGLSAVPTTVHPVQARTPVNATVRHRIARRGLMLTGTRFLDDPVLASDDGVPQTEFAEERLHRARDAGHQALVVVVAEHDAARPQRLPPVG